MRSRHHRLITAAIGARATAGVLGALCLLAPLPPSVASASQRPLPGPRPIRATPLPLPPDAATGDNAASNLFTIDCVRPGSCTAAGGYESHRSNFAPMVATQVNGRWQRATELLLPPNFAGERFGAVDSVDCARVGDCVAVGSYTGSRERTFGFVAQESGGRWGRGQEIALPRGAKHGYDALSGLNGVACSVPGTCLAVGDYSDEDGRTEPIVVNESHGRWARAAELPPPANAPNSVDQRAGFDSVACWHKGFCAVAGTYLDNSGEMVAMASAEFKGSWLRATNTRLPRGAAHPAGGDLRSVTCPSPSPGSCTAVGTYGDQAEDAPSMVVTESHGDWGRAHAVSAVPATADTSQPFSLNSVTCTKPGDCVAAGTYENKNGNSHIWIANESAGRWVRPSKVELPPNTITGIFADDEAFAVDCTRSGYCAFDGSYTTRNGILHALVAAFLAH